MPIFNKLWCWLFGRCQATHVDKWTGRTARCSLNCLHGNQDSHICQYKDGKWFSWATWHFED